MLPVALALATSLGVGYIPFAPGTFGSLAGLALWALLPHDPQTQLAVIVVLFAVGSWSAGVAEKHFNSTDPAPVVIDEVMGMLITLWWVPVGWIGAFAGFFSFRLFDIVKPWPSNKLEELHGGVGVMADDGMAALYANLALRAVLLLAAWLGWAGL